MYMCTNLLICTMTCITVTALISTQNLCNLCATFAKHCLHTHIYAHNIMSLSRFLQICVLNFVYSAVDAYGFERNDDFDRDEYEKFFSGYLSVLARRASKWKSIVSHREAIARNKKCKCKIGVRSLIFWSFMRFCCYRRAFCTTHACIYGINSFDLRVCDIVFNAFAG